VRLGRKGPVQPSSAELHFRICIKHQILPLAHHDHNHNHACGRSMLVSAILR
jgi:hypothetical protein